MNDEEQTIWSLIRESNRAWTEGALHELSQFFDDDVVVVPPGPALPVSGRDAVVRSYEEFVRGARTDLFEELEHSISVFGDTALVSYRFSIRYQQRGEDEARDETGREILALRRRDGTWRIFWRTQSAL